MKKNTITFLLLFTTYFAFSQDALQEAFTNSYSLEKSGNYAGAVQSIAAVYQAKSYECNIRLAYLKYMAGAYAESVSYYKKAIELLPYAIEAKLGMVLPLAAMGNWDGVLNQYAAVLKIDPNNSSVNYKLGYIYYTRKNYKDAYKCFEKVVNLYPFDYDGLLMHAWTNYRMGKYNEAKLLFKRVLLLSPGDKSATEGLSLIK